ncbi:MAG: hypothetical protein PHH13_02550 [Candidatus Peribacteraceae bacterium]|nr:hypothetical protein [Candidatus Peribacteraceae bacterium]
MVVFLAWSDVAMPPMNDFLQNKRRQHSADDYEYRARKECRLLGYFRNDVKKNVSEQNACRETDEKEKEAIHDAFSDFQKESSNE